MDHITEKKRIEIYRQSPDNLKSLYGSEDTGTLLNKIVSEYQIVDTDLKKVFIDIVGDCILGLYQKSQIPTLLIQQLKVPENIALNIYADLKDFLSVLPSEPTLPKADSTLKEKLELRPEGVRPQENTNVVQNNVEEQSPKPLTREEVLNSLAPKRTMRDDIAAVKKESQAREGEVPSDISSPTQKNEGGPETNPQNQ